ncbi:PLP-dependent aminotransferase family protein [Micromonospora cathayae]|uniref:PLP-dependent aminotransferase family protein n=1 Tax=Micromonospora cathayae TaxID=3028804 RepID=A0ABY7ZI23_9ACTN|nr:PLP-dependent aminotransferase family protein [Micromonospora sp. HUAS 3]WDZ82426.1 PLP-dependent aminotransferase family protein [Micromonospora sp. HUAS 3]
MDSVVQDLRRLAAAAAPGTRLPSVRELTARHHASPVTVAAALRQLVAQGIIETRSGRGTFVAARRQERRAPDLCWQTVALGPRRPGEEELQALLALPPTGAIALSGGYLEPDLQPAAALGAALARAARQPASWQRGPSEGREDLRAWFAREAGTGLRPDDMVICQGGQAALSSTLRALGNPGDTLLVESPTYLGALAAAQAAGLRLVPVPADADGVRPDQLAVAFAQTSARLFYCQPLYANPHGATLATHRRAQVAETVRAAGAFLIEDDYARDLAIDGDVPPPLAADDPDGHVIYLRSLTKSAAPGLRVAAIGARGPAGARLRAARLLDDFFVAGPLQQATLEFVTAPSWARHRRDLRNELRSRREALLSALARHLPSLTPQVVPRGGLHLWVRLPDGTDDVALAAAAAAEGVIVFPGRPWYAAEAPAPHLRLTYAAAPAQLMDEAVRRLASALDRR